MTRSRSKKVLFLAALTLLTAGAAVRIAAPTVARREILARLEHSCPACHFRLDRLEFGILSGRIQGQGIEVVGDPGDSTRYEAKADSLQIEVSPASLLEGKLWIRKLRVDGLELTLTEKGGGPPSTHAPTYPWLSRLPVAHVEAIEVRRARFTYAVTENGRRAALTFHGIDADSGPFGTRADISPEFVELKADASQGATGKVRLQIRVGLFDQEKIDDIEITGKNARLSDLDTFFFPDDGMRLSGTLREGHASIRVRNRHLTEQMMLDYQGLHVAVLADQDRSRLSALLGRVVASVLLHQEKDQDGSRGAPAAEIEIAQAPTFGIFKFLLQGLKEGAMAIVKAG